MKSILIYIQAEVMPELKQEQNMKTFLMKPKTVDFHYFESLLLIKKQQQNTVTTVSDY